MEELKEVFGGDKITNEDWREIIKEVDENQDGEVINAKFRSWLYFLSRSSSRNSRR